MGCGKSSIGRRLSSLTGYRFVDSDEQIVAAENRSITEIFADQGEDYFREVETRVLQELRGTFGIILATGGGAALKPENRALLREIGRVAWLDAEPDALFERAIRSGRRPLLQTENPRAAFDRLREARISIYEDASDFRVDSTHLSHDAVAAAVLAGVSGSQRQ